MQFPKLRNKNDKRLLIISVVVLLIIIVLWFYTYFSLRNDPPTERGTFGDMFGALNSLFSGLAFAGIIITILLQRNELELQRQELRETKEELKRSASAQEKSEVALKRQAENLKVSAKLSALNTLVGYYTEQENRVLNRNGPSLAIGDFTRKKNEYLKRIEEILEEKEEY